MDFPINRYFLKEPKEQQTLDLCRGDDDFRKVYIVSDDEKKIVIKHSCNTFTDEKRIGGWMKLMEAYRELGIYCPRIVPALDGRSVCCAEFDGKLHYAFAEEFAVYETAEHIGSDKLTGEDGNAVYMPDMLRALGRVASARLSLMDWPTAYCMLEPFCEPDTMDETAECAEKFVQKVKEILPGYAERAERLLELFYGVQSKLRDLYPSLPRSCFQGDLNESNVLVDGAHKFVGLIDFNLSGCEPVLNYAVREALWNVDDACLYEEDDKRLYRLYLFDDTLDDLRIQSFLRNMGYVQEQYFFSDYERQVFPYLFRYVNSFWWHHISAIEEVKGDDEKVGKLFHWLEKQMTRDDIRLL